MDEERRFGFLPAEKQFSMPCNESNRRVEVSKQRVDGIYSSTAAGKLNIGKNEVVEVFAHASTLAHASSRSQ